MQVHCVLVHHQAGQRRVLVLLQHLCESAEPFGIDAVAVTEDKTREGIIVRKRLRERPHTLRTQPRLREREDSQMVVARKRVGEVLGAPRPEPVLVEVELLQRQPRERVADRLHTRR